MSAARRHDRHDHLTVRRSHQHRRQGFVTIRVQGSILDTAGLIHALREAQRLLGPAYGAPDPEERDES